MSERHVNIQQLTHKTHAHTQEFCRFYGEHRIGAVSLANKVKITKQIRRNLNRNHIKLQEYYHNLQQNSAHQQDKSQAN